MVRSLRVDPMSLTSFVLLTKIIWAPDSHWPDFVLSPRDTVLTRTEYLCSWSLLFLWLMKQWVPINTLALRILEVSLGTVHAWILPRLALAPCIWVYFLLVEASFSSCVDTYPEERPPSPGPGIVPWSQTRHLNFLSPFPYLLEAASFYMSGSGE